MNLIKLEREDLITEKAILKSIPDYIQKFYIDIVVNFELDINAYNESKKVKHILYDNGKLDKRALNDYLTFILDAISIFDSKGLKMIERSSSKSSETSKYFTYASKEQFDNDTMEYVIFLRISDHLPSLSEDEIEFIKNKRERTAKKLNVLWKVRSILVNDETVEDYDEASELISKKADEYMNFFNKHPKRK